MSVSDGPFPSTTVSGAKPSRTGSDLVFDVVITSSNAVRARWDEVETALEQAFDGAALSPEFARGRPIEHTYWTINGSERDDVRHVAALDGDGELVGSALCIPTVLDDDGHHGDPGWMFTSHRLTPGQRVRIADALVTHSHMLLSCVGFSKVVTSMGSAAGAKFLSARHGYTHSPISGQWNRWERALPAPSRGCWPFDLSFMRHQP